MAQWRKTARTPTLSANARFLADLLAKNYRHKASPDSEGCAPASEVRCQTLQLYKVEDDTNEYDCWTTIIVAATDAEAARQFSVGVADNESLPSSWEVTHLGAAHPPIKAGMLCCEGNIP